MLSFTFNNVNSSEFGILIEEGNIYTKGKKNIEFITIPGRTGNLVVYDNSRANVEIVLNCHVEIDLSNKVELIEQLDVWLNGHEGYKTLSFSNGIEYKAIFIGELTLPTIEDFYTDFELIFSAYQ